MFIGFNILWNSKKYIVYLKGPSGVNQPAEINTAPPQLPYPTQHQGGMPVPYGATPATPYPAYVPPPMPTTYNPYATMPYPTQGYYTQYIFSSIISYICNDIFKMRDLFWFFLGGYNPYQAMPQVPYGGYATIPRYSGNAQPPHGQNPWWIIQAALIYTLVYTVILRKLHINSSNIYA